MTGRTCLSRVVFVATVALCTVGCLELGPEHVASSQGELLKAAQIKTPSDADPSLLRVMSYNIKFGGGRIDFFFDGHGEAVHMTAEQVHGNLDALLALVKEVNPDIWLAQEVDRDSRRSAFVDEAQYILDHSDMNYAAYVYNWRVPFVPDHGIGQVESGLVVFSKHPLKFPKRIDQGPIGDQDPITERFYLRRAIGQVQVDFGPGRELSVLNVHTAAYSTDGTKKRQIDQILAVAKAIKGPVLVGGDFNAVPPGTTKLEGFADEKAVLTDEPVHYKGENDWMDPFYSAFNPAIPLVDYQANQERYYSHSVDKNVLWTRSIDYLFSNLSWNKGGTVLQKPGDTIGGKAITFAPMKLSDHAPMVAWLLHP